MGTSNTLNEPQPKLFSIQQVPDKGRGMITSRDIDKGDRIISENPLFLMSSSFSSMGQMESAISQKLKELSKADQRQFLSLHNSHSGQYPFSNTMKTNALPCGPGCLTGRIYPTICLINHSCLPNAHNSWNSDLKCETIHTIGPIKVGDEITIPYDQGGPSDTRRKDLKSLFDFDCDCNLCSLTPADLQASDDRRLQIQALDESIGDPVQLMRRPEKSLAAWHSMLKLLKEEYKGCAGARLASLYYDA